MNERNQKVDVSALESALRMALARVVERRGPVLAIPHEYFWSIPVDAMYDVTQSPAEFTIGQLSDSIRSLEAIVSGEHEPIDYDLVWIADVLRAIGQGSE
ncbi:hypothetical protein [Rhodoglobus sp.]